MTVYEKVRTAITEYRLIDPGERVLAAVSGGPDSLAMLLILARLQSELDFALEVVHLNHLIRREAAAEAEFVQRFAEQLGVLTTVLAFDIPELLATEGGSMQEQAREVRYRLFQEVRVARGAQKIALGHHADDLAETVLMRFLRGAGPEGLVGFTPRSRDNLIRPLILLTRAEIEEFCSSEGLTPCYDQSNAKPVYFRNRVRLELLPLLEQEYNPHLRHELVQMSQILAEENAILQEYVTQIYTEVLLQEEPDVLTFKFISLSKKNPAILRRILRMGMEKLKGNKKNFYYQHYLQMEDLILHGAPGKLVHLPDGYVLYRGYETVCLGKADVLAKQSLGRYTLSVPGEVYLQEVGVLLQAEIREGPCIVSGNQAAFDADKLGTATLVVRSREPGDCFYPLGLTGKKKVKDYLIDEKVDRLARDLVPIVTTPDGHIVWIAGYRLDNRFKITQATQKTCILTILKGGKS